jgi:hypothetical protein
MFDSLKDLTRNRNNTPLLLIGAGAAILLIGNVGIGTLWPLFVLVPGLITLYSVLNSDDPKMVEGIYPGLMVTTTGGILLFQSLTGHWESWAYIWALYPLMVGIGMRYEGIKRSDSSKVREGEAMIRYAGLGLIVAVLFFEVMVFNNTLIRWGGLALVVVGIAMWSRRRRSGDVEIDFSAKKKKTDEVFHDEAA